MRPKPVFPDINPIMELEAEVTGTSSANRVNPGLKSGAKRALATPNERIIGVMSVCSILGIFFRGGRVFLARANL